MNQEQLQEEIGLIGQRLNELLARQQEISEIPIPDPSSEPNLSEQIASLEQRLSAVENASPQVPPMLLPVDDFVFPAEIVNAGPDGEANYADPRYWIKEQEATNTGEADTTNLTWGDKSGGLWVTATNLAEVVEGSHGFPDSANHRVMAYRFYDQSLVARYVFTSLPIVVD